LIHLIWKDRNMFRMPVREGFLHAGRSAKIAPGYMFMNMQMREYAGEVTDRLTGRYICVNYPGRITKAAEAL
jgi:hypothetical protein